VREYRVPHGLYPFLSDALCARHKQATGMTLLIAALITGIGLGSMYGLIALGFQITYSVSSKVNFAQGNMGRLGAVLAVVFCEKYGFPVIIGYPLAILCCVHCGYSGRVGSCPTICHSQFRSLAYGNSCRRYFA